MTLERTIKELVSRTELSILCYLQERSIKESNSIEISEIASQVGIRDKDDVIRALYTLEGKCLVEPFPVGDFTSSSWKITSHGLKAAEICTAPTN
jgi:hypothetical protein